MPDAHTAATPPLDELLEQLRADVDRYDPARYPVQHATACFHLGTTLLSAGCPEDATAVLTRAIEGFPDDRLPVEHAKATMMLGIARRDAGHPDAAIAAFTRAAALLAASGNELEAAASRFNAGLALRDLGQLDGARERFSAALRTFEEADVREHAAAAARELGATLLAAGDLDEAARVLGRSIELARRAGDRVALGAAANVLGIVHLTAGAFDDAHAAFADAAGAHPRSVRPAEHAMARANAALACQRAGHYDHARLAARQALAVPAADGEVVAQARSVLDELGDDDGALFAVLDAEPRERWVGILRSEQDRLDDVDDDALARHAAAVVSGLADRAVRAPDLAEAWLEVVLEQPPDRFECSIADVVGATSDLDPDAAATVRAAVASATARFPVPQLLRLQDTFTRAAEELGEASAWR